MAGWVGALAQGSESNWALCKAHGLWGTGSHRGRSVEAGDELFVWLSGRGWIAYCEVTIAACPAGAVDVVPWPDSERYRYVFGIKVVAEAYPPAFMTGAQIAKRLSLHTIQLGQFPQITAEDALQYLRTAIAERSG